MDMEEENSSGQSDISEPSGRQSEISETPRRYVPKKRNFKCSFPRCRHRTTSETRVIKHEEKTHCEGGKEMLKCEFPGCKFLGTFLPSMLERHLQVHQEKKPIPCLVEGCTYSTFRSDNFTAHIQRKHTDRSESSHPCTVTNCHYVGGTASDLRRHNYTHTDERNFSCDFPGCVYKAYQKSKVTRHKNTVHNKSATTASASGKKNAKAVKRINIQDHMAATGMTFTCKNGGCELSFKTAALLENHIKSHFDDRAYECPTCGFYAKRGKTMMAHMERQNHREIFPLWSTISQNWVVDMLSQENSSINCEDFEDNQFGDNSPEVFPFEVQMEIDVETQMTQQKKK